MPDVPLKKLMGSVFLPRNAGAEVHQDRIPEKRPEQHPQTVAAVPQITDQPSGDQQSLKEPDQHHQIIRDGIFCDRYLHGRRNLSSNPMNDFQTGVRTTTDDIIYPLFLANSTHFSIFHENKDENGSLKQNRDRGFASA